MTIKTKLILIFTSVTIIPVLIAGTMIIRTTRHTVAKTAIHEGQRIIHSRSQAFKQFLNQYRSTVGLLSRFPSVQGIIRSRPTGVDPVDQSSLRDWKSRLQSVFSAFIMSDHKILQIRYLDENGMEVVRVDSDQGASRIVPENKLQDKSGRDYFKEAINLAQGNTYTSPIELNSEEGRIQKPHTPVIRFAAPAYAETDGRAKGVIIINISIEKTLNSIIQRGNISSFIIIDQDGEFLFHPTQKNKEFGRVLQTGHNYFKEEPELRGNLELTDYKIHEDIKKQEFRIWKKIFYSPDQRRYWIVLEKLSKSEIFADIIPIEKMTYAGGLFTCAIIILIILTTVGRVVKPVQTLSIEAQKIMDGNLHVNIDPSLKSKKDEIGQLANSFDLMTNQLIKSNQDLEQTVRKRTKELRNKIEDLEQMNSLMVGRELKMAELKKEIETLKKKGKFS